MADNGLPKWNKTRKTLMTSKCIDALKELRITSSWVLSDQFVFCSANGEPRKFTWWKKARYMRRHGSGDFKFPAPLLPPATKPPEYFFYFGNQTLFLATIEPHECGFRKVITIIASRKRIFYSSPLENAPAASLPLIAFIRHSETRCRACAAREDKRTANRRFRQSYAVK